MKKLLLSSIVMCLVSSVSFATEVKPYIEGRLNENFMKVNFDDGYGFTKDLKDNGVFGGSVEIGTKLDQFRIGLEGYSNDTMEKKYYQSIYQRRSRK